ncbi:hypothetical protein MHYP_G00128290 [Metynnis hypsauchen]
MYLYKATCSDIPNPKPKAGQKPAERGQSRYGRQNSGEKGYPPLMCWGSLRTNAHLELKRLEEFLNTHTLSLQDSVRARTGMAYRTGSSASSALPEGISMVHITINP